MCHPDNPCSGKYGDCLDVILTTACNAKCSFCVQRNNDHYVPKCNESVKKIISKINDSSAKNILLLGGEPTIYPHLNSLLKEISKTKKVYLTTNGSRLSKEFVISSGLYLLSGLNISIHSASESINSSILNFNVSFENIRNAVKELKARKEDFNVRINANLSRDGISTFGDVLEIANLARHLGINSLRFAELQGVSIQDGFIFARDVFQYCGFDKEPFTSGCEKVIDNLEEFGDMYVKVRRVCGIVSKNLPPVINPIGRNATTRVLQPDGVITNGFNGLPDCHKNKNSKIDISYEDHGNCHHGNCH